MKTGRIVRVLVDENRNEIFNCNNEKRNLIVSIFYPVDNNWSTNRQALYKDLYYPKEQRFVEEWRASEDDANYINSLATNIYINAPIINNSTFA